MKCINNAYRRNQDGGVGRHTAPPRTTRTARGSDTKEIKNKHSSRPVGGAETGTGVERTRVAVAGLRLAECGTNDAGSPSTSRPFGPTVAQINPEGWTQTGGERAGRVAGSTPRHHSRPQITGQTVGSGGERSRPRNPGLQLREIKPQTSD